VVGYKRRGLGSHAIYRLQEVAEDPEAVVVVDLDAEATGLLGFDGFFENEEWQSLFSPTGSRFSKPRLSYWHAQRLAPRRRRLLAELARGPADTGYVGRACGCVTNPFFLAVRHKPSVPERRGRRQELGSNCWHPGRPGRLVCVDLGPEPQCEPDVVEASSKRCWVKGSRGKLASMPAAGASKRRRSRSIVISRDGSASTASSKALPTSAETCTGRRPALVELLRKMSPKRGEITASKP